MATTAEPIRSAPPSRATPPRVPTRAGRPTARLESVDLLRGLVIVLMVLDHVREYWSDTALVFQPTDLARTTPALFLTRWITHLCAPTFAALAGASVYLQWTRAAERGADRSGVARFQLTRGAWIALLDLTLVTFAMTFSEPFVLFGVVWAIGVGLMLLASLLRLRPAAVAAIGGALLVGCWLVAPVAFGVAATAPPLGALLWRLAFVPGPATPLPGIVAYPVLPWFGVVCLGFGLGPLFTREPAARRRALVAVGAAMLAAFVVARALHVGDAPWQPQRTGAYTALAFLNVTKYPPSPLFVLAALGCSLPLCALLDRDGEPGPLGARARDLLLAFGRTPLFTFVVHLYVIHLTALLVGVARGLPAATLTNFVGNPGPLRDAGWGFGLPVVYAIWVATCLAIYPLSRWYARRRAERPRWWMRYL